MKISTSMKQSTAAAAQEWLASSQAKTRRARIAKPLPITAEDGGLAGWLVGVVVTDRLVGFQQFDGHGTLLRTSWFPRRTSDCPPASAWLDVVTVRQEATKALRAGETAGSPRLTYDRDPSRLLWRVPVLVAGRSSGNIAVIGQLAYREDRHSGSGDIG